MKTRNIHGQLHVLRVAVVEESDALGKPLRLRLIDEQERVTLQDGMSFVTMYIPESNLRGRN